MLLDASLFLVQISKVTNHLFGRSLPSNTVHFLAALGKPSQRFLLLFRILAFSNLCLFICTILQAALRTGGSATGAPPGPPEPRSAGRMVHSVQGTPERQQSSGHSRRRRQQQVHEH